MHKLYLGDCLKIMPQLESKSFDMIFADLPYGITARNDWDIPINLDQLWKQYERIIKNNGIIIFTGTQPFTSLLVLSNLELFKFEMIWEKNLGTNFLDCNIKPLKVHENILIFYRKLPTYNPQMEKGKPYNFIRLVSNSTNYGEYYNNITAKNNGLRYPKTVLKINNENFKGKLHPTQKPLKLLEYLIKTFTNENDLILDNVMGSGTTIVVAIKLNRNAIGIELDEEYFKIAEHRIKIQDTFNKLKEKLERKKNERI